MTDRSLTPDEVERRTQRWRLVLGERSEASLGSGATLAGDAQCLDEALAALYELTDTTLGSHPQGSGKQGGRGPSKPNLSKWLGDIRRLFPTDIVQVIQADAIERRGLSQLLLDSDVLSQAVPDMSLATMLLSLKGEIPEKSKASARAVVKAVVDEIMKRLEQDLRRAVMGALNRREHSPISQLSATDWKRTIKRNLKNYDPESKRIIPERFYFFERQQRQKAWHVILDIDQSGSMSESILYASVMAAIFASLPALKTNVVAFDTQVVDLTDLCEQDPVEMLFGMQLGGGTDINQSVNYCQGLIEDPKKTLFILISDLYEGGVEAGLLRRLEQMKGDGVTVITLLALSDEGTPAYDANLGKKITRLGIPCFACTPDRLPELIAHAIKGKDLMAFESQGVNPPI